MTDRQFCACEEVEAIDQFLADYPIGFMIRRAIGSALVTRLRLPDDVAVKVRQWANGRPL